MIRKIVCPTDFSDVAQNAISYAAKLCQLTGANLELLHVEPLLMMDQVFSPRKITGEVQAVSQELNNVCNQINRMFNISCGVEVDTSGTDISEAIGREADIETLIVIGTNGADNLYQKVFGSNAYRVVTQSYPNILVVPQGVEFATINAIVYAWDYQGTKHNIFSIADLAGQFGSKLIFQHISKQDSLISKDVFKGFTDQVEEDYHLQDKIECRRMVNPDVPKGLTDAMKRENAQILAMSMRNGKLVRKLLQGGAGGAELPVYPLLILHND